MKKNALILCLLMLVMTALMGISVSVGDGTVTDENYPWNFWYKNSVSETIYLTEELNVAGQIIGLTYYNNFVTNLTAMPVNIWIGETSQTNLESYIPASELTMAFSGSIDFQSGQNSINISFDAPFSYSGGNIVILTERVMDTQYYNQNDKFYCTTTTLPNRTKYWKSDSNDYDPNNMVGGTSSSNMPNVTFDIITEGMGSVTGNITNGIIPLAGVNISIDGTNIHTVSANDGSFEFPYVSQGDNYILSASYEYYYTEEVSFNVVEDQETIVDVVLSLLPVVEVSGQVITNDTGSGIESRVILTGYKRYEVFTDVNGYFTIPGVFANHTYAGHVTATGYQDGYFQVEVEENNLELDNVLVTEILYPASDIIATVEGDNALVTWNQTRELVGYSVYRFLIENQANIDSWELIAQNVQGETYTDTEWSSLPYGYYKYAITAFYTLNIASQPAISNWIQTSSMSEVTISTTSNSNIAISEANVLLINQVPNPDGEFLQYETMTDQNGLAVISVNNGWYDITIIFGGFSNYIGEVNATSDIYIDATLIEDLIPTSSVVATIEDDDVLVTWNPPEEKWLWHGSGEYDDGFGTGGAFTYTGVVRYSATDLENYSGGNLEKIKFYPRVDAAEYTLKVWTNGSYDGSTFVPGMEVTSQVIDDFTAFSWTTVELDNSITLSSSEELWIGIEVVTPNGYPLGVDAGPAVIGKGDLIYFNNSWNLISNFNISKNFLIKAYISGGRNNQNKSRVISRELENYNVYRFLIDFEDDVSNWELLAQNISNYTYIDSDWTTLTYGYYKYAVKAVYSGDNESEATISNQLEKNTIEGEGTEIEPYLIEDLSDLLCLSEKPEMWVEGIDIQQIADIDASDTQNWNEGAGFSPIGNSISNFAGSYSGNNFQITGLFINRPETNYIGLFGYAEGATISNVKSIDTDIIGQYYVGTIVGSIKSSTISNTNAVGTVSSSEDRVGGLVGYVFNSTISNSYAEVLINGEDYVGGLVGYVYNYSYINNCIATGSVSGTGERIGGLAGYTSSATINNSYATGSVSGTQKVGGLVGLLYYESTINNSYSIGIVTGTGSECGGLVGLSNTSYVNNSFWDTSTSNQAISDGGTGKTTLEMQTLATYLNAGWDFTDEVNNGLNETWTFYNYSYPELTWQNYTHVILYPPTNLQANSDNGLIRLTWSAPDQQESNSRIFQDYNVYRDGVCINSEAVLDTFYTDTDLIHDETYQYYVTAVYDNGESVATNIVEVEAISLFLTGEGTEEEPYLINNLFDLYVLSQNNDYWASDTYIQQTADIDASDTQNWDDGAGFSPIGYNWSNIFRANYDGDNFSISNAYINRPDEEYVGLFGYTNGCTISNLNIIDIEVYGNEKVGGLVGRNYTNSSIGNCTVTGTITGTAGSSTLVGGLVGYNNSGSIINNCSAAVSVYGTNTVGGLVGYNNSSTITNSFSTSNINCNGTLVGGLVGYNQSNSLIENCYSIGSIQGNDNVGGFVGYNNNATISSSFSQGSVVSLNDNAGGLVAKNESGAAITNSYSLCYVNAVGSFAGGLVAENSSIITNCYSTGLAQATNAVGALIGYNSSSSVSNSFWDTDNNGIQQGVGDNSGSLTNVIGRTTFEMQTLTNYINAGWDFVGEADNGTEDVWVFNTGHYPNLAWQDLLVPEFTVIQDIVSANTEVTFTNLSIGDITNYEWDFGDGSSSYEMNPIHNYLNPGIYSVSLTIYGDDETATENKTDYITVYINSPSGLTAYVEDNENDVILNWQEQDGIWLQKCDDTNYNGIGFSVEAEFSVAIKYTQQELTAYQGMYLNSIKFFPRVAEATYTLKIWGGNSGMDELYSQEVLDFNNMEWNEYQLESTVPIPSSGEFYIGYRVYTPEGLPAGADSGPVVDGSNMIRMDDSNEWEYLHIMNSSLSVNFNIKGFVSSSGSERIVRNHQPQLELLTKANNRKLTLIAEYSQPTSYSTDYFTNTRELTGFKVYRNNNMIVFVEPNINAYIDEDLDNGSYEYYITQVYGSVDSEPSNRVDVTINTIEADFGLSDTTIYLGQSIDFINQSTGNIIDYLWEFGDGNTSGEENPSHTYSDAGIYNVVLTISNENNIAVDSLQIEVLEFAIIAVDTNLLSETLEMGQTATQNIVIENQGTVPLEWQINIESNNSRRMNNNFADIIANNPPALELAKGEKDQRVGYPVTRGSGGPDNYGYAWIDSNEDNGPNFVWNDISTIGISTSLAGDDNSISLSLPFSFDFYGNEYESMFVSSNGIITFGSGNNTWTNQAIPTTVAPNNMIAAFWDDLHERSGQTYYYYDQSGLINKLIFQFSNWGRYSGSGAYNFQIHLCENGDIYFYYSTMTGTLTTATIGLENNNASDFLPIAFNTAFIEENMCIKISNNTQWLIPDIYSGTILPNENQPVELTFDSNDLMGGLYEAQINIVSNDPYNTNYIVDASLEVINFYADFSVVSTFVDEDSEIYFENLSVGNITSYLWDFGDGGTSVEQNPLYIYNIPGTYIVSLTINNEFNSSTEIKYNYITVNPVNYTPALTLPDSLTFAEDTSLEVDFSQYITDIDEEDELILNAENGDFIDITMSGFTVTFTAPPDWFGSEVLYFSVDDQAGEGIARVNVSKTRAIASDSVEVIVTSVDDSMFVQNQIEDINEPMNSNDIIISLVDRFGDIDSEITSYVITGNTNPEMISTSIIDTTLTISISENMYGEAEIEITAYNDDSGQISMTFFIDIYPTPEISLAPEDYSVSVLTGESFPSTMTIENIGLGALDWEIDTVNYLEEELPEWVYIAETTGSLGVGDNQVINLSFSGESLSEGTYHAEILVSHNNPNQDSVIIPVTMTVLGLPGITVSTTSLNFGNVFVNSSERLPLVISNSGTSPLVVNNIATTGNYYSVNYQNFTIPVGQSRTIEVTFNPTAIGNDDASMNINSTDYLHNPLVVSLFAEAIDPPTIEIVTEALNFYVLGSGVDTETILIRNNGASSLEYNLQATDSWLSFNPYMGQLGSEEEQVVTITANPGNLLAGIYNSSFTVGSNVPGSQEAILDFEFIREIYNVTDFDNENNNGEGVADNDLDFSIGYHNQNAPIEFNIYSNNPAPQSANLSIRAWNIDDANGGIHTVSLNGYILGNLRGIANAWTTSLFDIEPSYLSNNLVNLIQIQLDTDFIGNDIEVDWGQLSYDNTNLNASIRYINLDKNSYYSGANVEVSEEIDTNLSSQEIRVETVIYSPWHTIVASSSRVQTIYGSQSDTFTETLEIAEHYTPGVYELQVIVYDNNSNLQEALFTTDFEVKPYESEMFVEITSLDFGAVLENETSHRVLTLKNVGHADLLITDISSNQDEFTTNITSFNIAYEETQDIILSFTPSALGQMEADLTIMSNASNTPALQISLSGVGIANVPYIEASHTNLDFGDVYTILPELQTVVVKNIGHAPLVISQINSDNPVFMVEENYLGRTLTTYQELIVNITFAPETVGSYNGNITIVSNADNSANLMIPVSGVGSIAPQVTYNPNEYQIAMSVGESTTETLELNNSGGNNLTWNIKDNFGKMFELDGFNSETVDYGFIRNRSSIQLYGGNFAVELWFKVDSNLGQNTNGSIANGGRQCIVSKSTMSQSGSFGIYTDGIDNANSDKNLKVTIHNGTNKEFLVANSIELNQWYHVAVSYNNNTLLTYLDGSLVSQESLVGFSGNYDPWILGKMNQTGNNWYRFAGALDEFRIWESARTEAQVINYKNVRLVGNEESLAGYWNFDEEDLRDTSSYQTAGVIYGNASITQSSVSTIPSWIAFSTTTGEISAGSQTTLDINLDASEIIGGMYNQTIELSSNDPDESMIEIPLNIVVSGIPNISISNSLLDFGNSFIGYSDTLSVLITNTGTDVLQLDNFIMDNQFFTTLVSDLDIPSGESERILINFAPSEETSYNGELTFTTNLPGNSERTIEIIGNGVYTPQIAISQNSFSATANSGELTSQQLTISNVQGEELNFTLEIEELLDRDVISGEFNNLPVSNKGMVWVNGYLYVVSYSQNKLYKYDIESESVIAQYSIHTSPFGITYDGENLWIGSSSGNLYRYDLSGNQVAQFSSTLPGNPAITWNGEHLFICSSSIINPQIYTVDNEGSVINSTVNTNFGGKLNQIVFVPEHTGGELWGLDYSAKLLRQLEPDSGNELQQISYNNFSGISFALAHNGRDLWIAPDVVANPKLYRIEDGIEEFNWLTVTPDSGSLLVGEDQVVTIEYNARNLFAGNYQANLLINSNDAETPQLVIDVNLEVNGQADILVSRDEIEFGTTYTGQSLTEELVISNTGSAFLDVSDIITNNPEFILDETSFTLAPLSSKTLNVSFTPANSGVRTATLIIMNNDDEENNYQVELSGIAEGEPTIVINPSLLTAGLSVDNEETQTIRVSNIGGSDLNYSLSFDEDNQRGDSFSVDYELSPIGLFADASDNSINNELPYKRIFSGERNRFLGDFIASYPNMPVWNAGMYWLNNELYIVDYNETNEGQATGILVKYNLETNQVTASYPIHTLPYGITYDGSYLWIGSQSGSVFGYDPNTFNNTSNPPVGSFTSPVGYFPAITYIGDSFLINRAFGDNPITTMYRVSHSGDILESYSAYLGKNVSQLAWVEQYYNNELWAFQNVIEDDVITGGKVLKLKLVNGSIAVSQEIDFYDNSVIYSFANNGKDLWISDSAGPLYQIDDERWLSSDIVSRTISPNEYQDVNITLDPTGIYGGEYSGNIRISSNDPQQELETIPVTMIVQGYPEYTISTNQLNFGEVALNYSKTEDVTFTNTGSDELIISEITFNPESVFTILTSISALAPGETGIISVLFSPDSNNEFSTNMNIETNIGSEIVALNGQGYLPPIIGLSLENLSSTLNYGEEETEELIISNSGDRALTYEIVIDNNDRANSKSRSRDVSYEDWLSVNPASGNVLAGNNEPINITISASNIYAGSYSAQLIISSNDPEGSEVIPVELSVTGTPTISVSEANIEFGSVLIGNSNTKTFTVTNSGSSSLQVTSVNVNSNEFLVTPPSLVLAPEAMRTITVSFTPQSQGNKSANVLLVSNDMVNGEQSVTLAGYGMEASAEISTSTSSLEFSDVNVGNSKDLEFTLYNQGTGVLKITGISSNHPDFISLLLPTANNPINIQPGNSRVMIARFTPTGDTGESALLSIASNAYNNDNLQITMSGTGNYIPRVSLNKSSLDWFMLDNTIFYDEIIVINEGQAPLDYSLTAETIAVPWFEANPISGSIGVGASAIINLTIDTRNINNGSFFADFIITSNDPDNETISVPMILNHSNFNFTETDNAGNEFVETPDYDLGVDINENSPNAPVEFFIYTDESEINFAKLRIRAYDIDSGEINYVFVNGTWVGQLVGRNNNYSITEFALDPALINLGEDEANEIEITLDVNSSSSGYSKIIWGQFVFNQSPIYASINSLNLASSNYYPAEEIEVNSILTTQLYSQTVRAEYELLNANLVVLDSYFELLNLSVTSNYQASASLQLPNDIGIGSYSVKMSIYDNETNIKQSERTTSLNVLSGDPVLSVNEQINFGDNYIAYPRMRNIQITNQGYAPLSITSLTTSNSIFSVIDRTFVLQNGESETVSVTFESLTEGSFEEDLLITSNDPNNPSKVVALSANAIEPPQLELSTTAIVKSIPRFATDEANFTISNTGNTALNISSIAISGASWLSVNPASIIIAPDSSEEIELSFSSYDLNEGNYNAIVEINSNDPENSTSLINVTMVVLERLITANFSATPLSGAKNLEVEFTNYSQTSDDSEITEYAWDFQDDGTIDSYEINPTFIYENRGQYSVRLTVHNENSETHSLLRTAYIDVINTAPILVSAIPNIVMNEDGVNQDIDLQNHFTDADNDNLNFNVSGNDHLQVQISNGIVTITPEEDWFGIEELTFTATDSYQAIASGIITVTVVDVSDAPSFVNLPQSITLWQTTKEVIDFANHLYDPEQSLSLLSLSIANNEHISYDILGLEVTLIAPSDWIGMEILNICVSDGTGRLVTSQEIEVNITDTYQASFEADITEVLAGEAIQFTDLTNGNPNHWIWYLDGDNVADSNEQNPSNPYNTSGVFSISLVVSYIDEEGILVASDSMMYEDYITVEGTSIPGGNYFGTWEVAFSPYNVYGQVAIEAGTALTIEEGTVVNFMENTDFIVEGGLIADGVIFGVAENDTREVRNWQGLKFTASGSGSNLSNCTIKNSVKALEINNSSPLFSGINIEGVDSAQPAIKIIGGSQAILDNFDIDKFNTGIEILGDSSTDVPIITNIRIRHTTNTSRMVEDTQVAVKINNSNLTISDLDIEGYSKAIKIESTLGSSTPTLSNIRVRHTTNTSRSRENYALKVIGNSSPILHEVDIDEFSKALVFDALNSSTTPTLTNIRVRHTTNTSRNLDDTALEFIGSINAVIDSLDIDDYTTALSFDNSTRAESSSPTLTNIRVRHTTNTSRTNAVALKSIGKVDMHIVGFESDNVKDGLSFYSDEATIPTLTNIRVRHTTNTARDLGGTGIKMVGLIEAVMDSIQVDDCLIGIDLENLNRTESTTPTLTNIRVRHTTNTSRINAVAFKSFGLVNFKMTNFESENVQDGIILYSDDEVIPVITNIRVRHTTNTRNMGTGITLSECANAWIRNSLVEGFNVGIKVTGNNQAIVEKNAIIDNLIAVEISGEEVLAQIHHNHIENQLEGEVTSFLINDNNQIEFLNNNILGFERIVTGANSSPYFCQNIIWGQDIALSDLASGNEMNATFEYNDIQMASGFAPGLGNMNQDPNFIDSDDYDLELSIYSNCIDAGNPNLEPDPDDSIADLGMNYVHHFNNFNSTSRFVTLGSPIQFNNKSEGHDDVNTMILWEFGDGESSEERNPVHTYEEIGLYTTTLTMRTGSYTDIKSSQAFIVSQENAISAPQNPTVTLTGASINLTWEEVTESTIGNPVENVTYLVYSCDELDGIFEYRTDVETLNWTDSNIGLQADRQFYFILSFVGNERASLQEFIRTHRFLKRSGQVVNSNMATTPKYNNK